MMYLLLLLLAVFTIVSATRNERAINANSRATILASQQVKTDKHLHKAGVELLDRHDIVDRFLGEFITIIIIIIVIIIIIIIIIHYHLL
jgi:hypothetical protein